MAGLGGSMMQPGAAPAEQGEPAAGGPGMDEAPAEGTEAASPEEQALYDKFVHTALDVIYSHDGGGKVSPQILADLKGQFDERALTLFKDAQPPLQPTPADSVAATAVVLTIVADGALGLSRMAADQQGQQQGAQPDPDQDQAQEPDQDGDEGAVPAGPDYAAVILHAGKAIVEELIEVAEAAKLHEFSDQDVEGVMYRAMDLYRVASEASGNPAFDKEGLARQFGELVAANDEGKPLGAILPGLPGGAPLPRQAA